MIRRPSVRALTKIVSVFCLMLGFVFPLRAQRPAIFTESPITVGNGHLNGGLGIEYLKKNRAIPSRAPISLWKIPSTRVYLGAGEIVDAIIDWRGRLIGEQGTGRHVSDWGDISLGTKINFLKERKKSPSLGLMYLVKLPNTSHDELLGSNATDFFFSLLGAKQLGELQLRANLGVGILDDPEHPHSQLDIYPIGAALIAPLDEKSRLFLEWAGFLGPHKDQAKFVARGGVEIAVSGAAWSLFGSFRVIGDERDFGTAFEYSESWGVGLVVRKEFSLW